VKLKLCSIIAFLLVAVSLATHWQAFITLREMNTISHLAAFSDHSHHDAESRDHDEVEIAHTHKHRHAPDQSEHEHTHLDPGYLLVASNVHLPQIGTFDFLRLPSVQKIQALPKALVPLSQVLSLILRPPVNLS